MDTTSRAAAVYSVAIIMERSMLAGNRWQTEQWEAKGVLRDSAPAGSAEQVIVRDEKHTRILFPGHQIRLYRDEAEGY